MRILASTKTMPVELEFASGEIRPCLIQELLAEESDAYALWLNGRISQNDNDPTGMKAELVSRCLVDAKTMQKIPKAEILKFSSTAQNVLKDLCDEWNGHTIDSVEKAKKRIAEEKKS